jgi:hypothetical protein
MATASWSVDGANSQIAHQPDAPVLKLRVFGSGCRKLLPKSEAPSILSAPDWIQGTGRGRSLAMVILQDAVPGLKRFLSKSRLNTQRYSMITRLLVAFMMRRCRMSASQAAGAVRAEPRHRGQVCRFLGRKFWQSASVSTTLYEQLLVLSAPTGTWLFILDQTLCSQQGDRTENTYSSGNRQKRPRKGRRYNKYKYTRKRCHCFVMGLLISPEGIRIPLFKSYYTEDYCKQTNRPYRRQTELAAELIRELPLPKGSHVIILGDTAFDALVIREACEACSYHWIVPLNPERVLEGKKPRPKVWSLVREFSAGQFTPVRLHPGRGEFVAQRRVSPHRMGPKRNHAHSMCTRRGETCVRLAECSSSFRHGHVRTKVNRSKSRKS